MQPPPSSQCVVLQVLQGNAIYRQGLCDGTKKESPFPNRVPCWQIFINIIFNIFFFIYIYNHIILFTCFQSPVHSVQTEFFTWNNETAWNWFSSSGRVNPTKNSANKFCNWLSIPRRSFASQNSKPNWWGVGYKEIMQAKRCETPSRVDGHLLCVKVDGSRVCPTITWWWDTHTRT